MYSQKPEMAKRWSEHTPKGTKLPEKVKKAMLHLPLLDLVKLAASGRKT